MQQLDKMDNYRINNDSSFFEIIILIKRWINFLINKWLTLFIIAFIGSICGILYSLNTKPLYIASSTFVVEESKSGGLGQYAGIASMMGIDINSGGGGIFQGDNLLELYQSRLMIQKALLTRISIEGRKDSLINIYIKFNELRKIWNKAPALKNIKFNLNNEQKFNRIQDSLIGRIANDIKLKYLNVSKPDKKLNIIKVDVRSNNELFSKLFNDVIVDNVNDFYVQTKTKKAMDNLLILQHQTDSIRRELNRAISGVATSIDANPNANPSRQFLRVPSQNKQIDAEANKNILVELVKSLEMSKVSLRQETPLIQIIDHPYYPLEVKKFGLLKGVVLGFFLFLFIGIIVLVLNKIYKDIINEQ